MRKTIWNFKGTTEQKEEARENGLKYIETLKKEDEVIAVVEDKDKFTILLKDKEESIL